MDVEAKLASEDFEVQRYIRDVAFRYDSSAELKQHKRRVQGLADQTAQKLKQNVYKNYELFIDTSKEISSLEAEMYQLSHLLHEHEVLTHSIQSVSLTEEGSAGPSMTAEKREKLSIASLLESVEGCSIVTEVPGRYIVHCSHLVELDQESYEANHLVKAFLLNDSLMIGSLIKKRRGPVRYRYQALYELDNMAIVDVKDSDLVSNAFKILMFPDSHLYQAENVTSKHQWIEMLETTKRKYKVSRDVVRKGAGSRPGKQHEKGLRHSLTDAEHRQAELLTADWLKDVPENLDVYIAQREFEQAVSLIEKTKAYLKDFSDSHAVRDVRARLNHRINQLSKVLMKELEASPSGSLRGGPRAARRAVGLLLRLGRSAKACELFLKNHRQIIIRDLEDVKTEGATSLYIANLSATFFRGLHNAALEFVRAFGENNGSYSAFIVWCYNQLCYFTQKSAPVIFGSKSLATVTDCVAAVCKECDSLQAIGIDLTFALLNLYHPHLCQALSEDKKRIIDACATMGTAESWQPLDLTDDHPQLAAIMIEMENLGIKDFRKRIHGGAIVDLSKTTITFCKSVFNFVSDALKLQAPDLLVIFIDAFCDIFNNMVVLYVDAIKRDENIPMMDSIVGDCEFVINTVLPTIGERINSLLGGMEMPELVELHAKLQNSFDRNVTVGGSSAEPEAMRDSIGSGVDMSGGEEEEEEDEREEEEEEEEEVEQSTSGESTSMDLSDEELVGEEGIA